MQGYQLELLETSPTLRGRAFFPSDFPGFDGHFPGNPLLPGFLHVQAALDLLSLAGITGSLRHIESAKFTRPILPGQPILLELTAIGPHKYDVTLTSPEFAELHSRFILTLASQQP